MTAEGWDAGMGLRSGALSGSMSAAAMGILPTRRNSRWVLELGAPLGRLSQLLVQTWR